MQLHLWRSQEVVSPQKTMLGKDKGAPTHIFVLQWRLELTEQENSIASTHGFWDLDLFLLPVRVEGIHFSEDKVQIRNLRAFVDGSRSSCSFVDLSDLVISESRLRNLATDLADFFRLLRSYGADGEYASQETLSL